MNKKHWGALLWVALVAAAMPAAAQQFRAQTDPQGQAQELDENAQIDRTPADEQFQEDRQTRPYGDDLRRPSRRDVPDVPRPDRARPDRDQTGRENADRASRRNRDRADGQEQDEGQGPTAQLGVLLSATRDEGLIIQGVDPNGAAAAAGLQMGDQLLSIDGRQVQSADDAQRIMRSLRPQQVVEIVIVRDGEEQTLEVALGQRRSANYRNEREMRPDDRQADADTRRGPARERMNQQRGWLGVSIDPADDQGVRITNVYPSSPAARAGLRTDDVIVSVEGESIESPQHMVEVLSQHGPQDRIELEVLRNDQRQTIQTSLAAYDTFVPGQRWAYDEPEQPGYDDRVMQYSEYPEHAMMLEQHRHLASQHQRLESLLLEALQKIDNLEQQLQQLSDQNNGRR